MHIAPWIKLSISHIPEMLEAGIDSFKIEGRMKTALYVATVGELVPLLDPVHAVPLPLPAHDPKIRVFFHISIVVNGALIFLIPRICV